MESMIEHYKGTMPGAILDRFLAKRQLRQSDFARLLTVPPQTLNAVIKGRRPLTPELALKIDLALELEEGTMLIFQALYDTKKVKREKKLGARPEETAFRKILFWDTKYDKIDWQANKDWVIRRVLERGNDEEKKYLESFYGKPAISEIKKAMVQYPSHHQ